MKIKINDMPLFILKSSDNMYWCKENNYTPYANTAKLYSLKDAKVAAERRGLDVYKAKFIPGKKPFTYFVEEDYKVNI